MSSPIMKILRVIAFWIFLAMCYYFCHTLANNHYRNRLESSHNDDDEDEGGDREQGNANQIASDSSTNESHAIRKMLISSTLISKKIVSLSKKESDIQSAKEIEIKSNVLSQSSSPSSTLDHDVIVGIEMESEEQTNKRKQKEVDGVMSRHSSLSSSSPYSKSLVPPIHLKNISNKTCFICLCEYEEGEIICSSPNPQCVHSFHMDCIMEWLMRHDECPCCRNDYLDINSTATTTSPTPNADWNSSNNNPTDVDVEMGITVSTEAPSDPPGTNNNHHHAEQRATIVNIPP